MDGIPLGRKTLKLPHQLTDDELLKYGHKLGEVYRDAADVEQRKAETAAAIKAELETLKTDAGRLALALRTKTEDRPTECEEFYNPRTHRVDIVRTDTGEVVDQRDATHQERQMRMAY